MHQKPNQKASIDSKLAKKLSIAIVRTDYYQEFNDNLEKHCRATLTKHGVSETQVKTFSAPGSWEIPLLVQQVAQSKKFDAIIAFGVIVKGDTLHFDMIANEVGRALMNISLENNIPVALEILATFNLEDAKVRASDNDYNKGIEGALAALKTLQALEEIK